MIRVLVVDDHPLFRRGVVTLLSELEGITVTGEAVDGLAALRVAESAPWDVAVIDLSLPRLSGAELLKRLRAQFPTRKILVLSQYAPEQMADRVRLEGADAYVWKAGPPDALVAAIRAVAAGEAAESESPLERPSAQLPHERLSAREYQIFTLIYQGRTVSEVAAELNLAMPTVSTHLKNVREKLGARTTADVIAYAHRAGLAS